VPPQRVPLGHHRQGESNLLFLESNRPQPNTTSFIHTFS